MIVLITGAAGFIGAALAQRLLAAGHQLVGLDNFSDYYEVSLKRARWRALLDHPGFMPVEADLAEDGVAAKIFEQYRPQTVVHLAAQPGVRYSVENPANSLEQNVFAFFHLLEACRQYPVGHLLFASSSSVYGDNPAKPWQESSDTDHPRSLYAASKKSMELMAHSYASLYGLPCTALRFFTVYGPWGRPDMAPFIFAEKMLRGEELPVFSAGKHSRDFSYINDVIRAVEILLEKIPPGRGQVPWEVYNLGNGQPVSLLAFIDKLAHALGCDARLDFREAQAGDVSDTYADKHKLESACGDVFTTSLEQGLQEFANWYRSYYGFN